MGAMKKRFLGIEAGSTRIKAVLIDETYASVASGNYDWENRLEDGVWTYNLGDVWHGIQEAFKQLNNNVKEIYGSYIESLDAIGISAMMHGFLPFDKDGNQLSPFRTWRNVMTEKEAEFLTKKFEFNIPQRWSIAHLYQAMMAGESYVKNIAFLTTLSGYIHWRLTGKKVLGVGDASGMFPIDSTINDYDQKIMSKFDELTQGKNNLKLKNILPQVLCAGMDAGVLTKEGAALLDPSGTLKEGAPLCPPEGDAGTGMVATNSIMINTGNVSAGTSIFAMIVLENALKKVHTEIDMVTTPEGKPVAMVHCNNCTSDIDAWIKMFGEAGSTLGANVDKTKLYELLYTKALEADADCGGLVSFNYYSGEPITLTTDGRPLFVRKSESRFTLANLMRSLLFGAMATLRLGMDIITKDENVTLKRIMGHGGLFKTKIVAQRLMASALEVPLAVMESAGEGGAWGIALLAAYLQYNKTHKNSLSVFLQEEVFEKNSVSELSPDKNDVLGFLKFMERYKKSLEIEKTAARCLS
ncbi:MAG: FGGY-family carbohydrate kinase [Termitinemataceae bacterium]|nr:MAG: FGGY-family carbohydrate kinase [Termitinemataceae bacterium]